MRAKAELKQLKPKNALIRSRMGRHRRMLAQGPGLLVHLKSRSLELLNDALGELPPGIIRSMLSKKLAKEFAAFSGGGATPSRGKARQRSRRMARASNSRLRHQSRASMGITIGIVTPLRCR
jgi:hypothetical protein